jgi:hypothetical protein
LVFIGYSEWNPYTFTCTPTEAQVANGYTTKPFWFSLAISILLFVIGVIIHLKVRRRNQLLFIINDINRLRNDFHAKNNALNVAYDAIINQHNNDNTQINFM